MAFLLQDQVVPQEKEAVTIDLSVPMHWDNQSTCVDLNQVKTGSPEWKMCEDKFTSMMPVVVKQVTRVQNMWLWEAYQFNKYRMERKKRGIHNELILYHGTRENNPMVICQGEDGFDLRLSNKGSWGVALYFAENSPYADRFAYITPEGDRELLIAYVLVGESYDCGTKQNKEMKMPPVKEKSK